MPWLFEMSFQNESVYRGWSDIQKHNLLKISTKFFSTRIYRFCFSRIEVAHSEMCSLHTNNGRVCKCGSLELWPTLFWKETVKNKVRINLAIVKFLFTTRFFQHYRFDNILEMRSNLCPRASKLRCAHFSMDCGTCPKIPSALRINSPARCIIDCCSLHSISEDEFVSRDLAGQAFGPLRATHRFGYLSFKEMFKAWEGRGEGPVEGAVQRGYGRCTRSALLLSVYWDTARKRKSRTRVYTDSFSIFCV